MAFHQQFFGLTNQCCITILGNPLQKKNVALICSGGSKSKNSNTCLLTYSDTRNRKPVTRCKKRKMILFE